MKYFSILTAAAILLTTVLSNAQSELYTSSIEYQQAVTRILKYGDISWSDKTDDYYVFNNVMVSDDGTRVLFDALCEFCGPAEKRAFLVSPDGSGLQDISSMLPSDITSRWSAWRNLLINQDGSKVFFRAVVEAGYYDDEYLYVYDVATSTRSLAVNQVFGPFSTSWQFRINETGSRVYLDKYDAGTDEGLFYANTGGTRVFYFNVDDLPCTTGCGNLNFFHLMGVSSQNDLAFFSWDSNYFNTDGSNQHTGVWYTGLSGVPTLITDEHYWVGEGDWRGVSNKSGTKLVYRYKHASGDPNTLAVVSVASKTETVIGGTSDLNGFKSHMSPSGNYVLVNGEYGDFGTYYQTMINLSTGKSRDTWSYHLMDRWKSTSNITADDRYYFYSTGGSSAIAGVYRIDMKSQGDTRAPFVQNIKFDAPVLLDHDGITLGVQVKVTDPQGIGTIEWVKLLPIIEGQEAPSWYMPREPLAFPAGDPGSTLLYDDGTNGDSQAGDGVFSFDSIATRKGDREGESAWNTWYQHYALPAWVGIRVIVKDADNNYAIADTQLMISKLFTDSDQLEIKVDEYATVNITGAGSPYTVSSSSPSVATATVDNTTITIHGISRGNAVLTVQDSIGNTTTVDVIVKDDISLPAIYLLLTKP